MVAAPILRVRCRQRSELHLAFARKCPSSHPHRPKPGEPQNASRFSTPRVLSSISPSGNLHHMNGQAYHTQPSRIGQKRNTKRGRWRRSVMKKDSAGSEHGLTAQTLQRECGCGLSWAHHRTRPARRFMAPAMRPKLKFTGLEKNLRSKMEVHRTRASGLGEAPQLFARRHCRKDRREKASTKEIDSKDATKSRSLEPRPTEESARREAVL